MSFIGTGVALVTPFTTEKKIDELSLRNLVESVITGGCDFLVALGTTAEASAMSQEEKYKVLEIVIDSNKKRVPIMVGIGGNNTLEVLENIRKFPYTAECQAILSVVPYYNKPSQEGIYQHFKAIAAASSLPIFLYNVPGRTSVNMSAETTVRLSHDFKNIIGIKEAADNFQQLTEILRDKREDFIVLSGNDDLGLPAISVGADGVISVIANLFPKEYSSMLRDGLKGDFVKARKMHLQLSPFFKYLFQEGNPAGVKAGLQMKGIIQENELRLPLVGVSAELSKTISGGLIHFQ